MLAASEITAKSLDPQQRWLMRLLPVVFTVFLLTFPAGLFMYWITSNLVTLGQNYVIYNYGPGRKPPKTADMQKKSPKKGSASQQPTASQGSEVETPRQKGGQAGGRRRRRKRKK